MVTYHTDLTSGAPSQGLLDPDRRGRLRGCASRRTPCTARGAFRRRRATATAWSTSRSRIPPALRVRVAHHARCSIPVPGHGVHHHCHSDKLETYAANDGLTLAQEEQKEISVDVFLMFAWATWLPASQDQQWLEEGAAQWAGYVATGYPSVGSSVAPPDIALDCRDSLVAHQMCDPDGYVDSRYPWAFFQMLANEYGTSFVKNAFVNGAAGQTATTALSNAIAAKGSSLASQFNAYAADLLNGSFGVPALAAVRPAPDAAVVTGTTTEALPGGRGHAGQSPVRALRHVPARRRRRLTRVLRGDARDQRRHPGRHVGAAVLLLGRRGQHAAGTEHQRKHGVHHRPLGHV